MTEVTYRPLTLDDGPALARMLNRRDLELFGQANHWELTISENLSGDGFDLGASSRAAILPGGALAGFEVVYDNINPLRANTWGCVDSDWRNRGIGSALLKWAWERAAQNIAKAPPEAQVSLASSAYFEDTAGKALLLGQGFELVRTFYTMRRDFEGPPTAPVLPEGFRLTTLAESGDLRSFVEVDNDAFRDHWGFIAPPLDEAIAHWKHEMATAPEFDPRYWWIAHFGDIPAGVIMTMTTCNFGADIAWVSSLGVRREFRKRGLGSALLETAFAAHFGRGSTGIALGVDASSMTNAVALYERAGMKVFLRRGTYEKVLRPGTDLAPH